MSSIEFATIQDLEQLKELWIKSFNDTKSYVDMFYSYAFHFTKTPVLRIDGKIASMLTLVPIKIKINDEYFKASYIFAACTDEKHRGKGLMSKLINQSLDYSKTNNEIGVVLVPQTESLQKFYKNLGFTAQLDLAYDIFNKNSNNMISDLKCQNCSLAEFINMRKGFQTATENSVCLIDTWLTIVYESGKLFGDILKITDSDKDYYAVISKENGISLIEASFPLEDKYLNFLCNYYSANQIILRKKAEYNSNNQRIYGLGKFFDENIEKNYIYMNLMLD